MEPLEMVAELSHEFGTDPYVLGGGGNTSVKDASTLWVKPSGTTLREIEGDQFVALDRARVAQIYEKAPPADASAREAFVKDHMLSTVRPGSSGRPSVEAPLHNVFEAAFVVHTHMTLLNGMTCARDGESACRKYFPDALWMDYVDPGYTLCMRVREEVDRYAAARGAQPSLVIMKNHGVFVAADTVEAIRAIHQRLEETFMRHYESAGTSMTLARGALPGEDELAPVIARVREIFGEAAACVAVSGRFEPVPGPLSPDHIVYAKAYPYTDALDREPAEAFVSRHGYAPRVVSTPRAVFGIGPSRKTADMALALAADGALVRQLTEAFGGVEYMSEAAAEFIENWEVEAYRSKVSLGT